MSKLAIIIPFYKIDFFEDTIRSLVAQTNKNFVLYIGNDASKSNPKYILDQYLSPEEYFYVDYKENFGSENLALQWERILENVQEEWVQFLGDDDGVMPYFVANFYEILPEVEKERINIIKCGIRWIDEESKPIKNYIYNYNNVTAAELFIKKYNGEIRSSLSENIYRTCIVKKIKFTKLPLAWGTDDLSLLDFSENKNVKYIAKHLVDVRISQESITGSASFEQKKQNAIHQLREKIALNYSKKLPKSFIHQVIEDYLNSSYQKALPINRKVLWFYLSTANITQFLKSLRKTFYIYKKHKM